MPSIWQRATRGVASVLLREDVRNLRAKAMILDRMGREGMAWQPWLSANPSVLRELLMDTETLDFLTMQLQWQNLSGQATGDDNESMRQQVVNLSRYYYHNDPTTWHSIRIITDFSLGRTIKVVCEDEQAQPVWDAFWTSPSNRVWLSSNGLKRASDIWLVDGEFIPVFFTSTLDGEVRMRRFPTDQITELVTDPDDADAVVLYKRVWTETNKPSQTMYYRDWRATDKDVRKALDGLGGAGRDATVAGDRSTDIAVMLGAVNTISNRGWPWASRSMPWAEIYSQFIKDRAAVASSVALWVREMKVKSGGSRGVDALRDQIRSALAYSDTETNPPPAAGSTLVTNPAVDVTEKPLTTGAGDASRDSLMFATIASNGAGLPPFYSGHAESTANYATAQIIAQPAYEMFAGYGEMWRSMVQDMVDHVLTMWERYGRDKNGMRG